MTTNISLFNKRDLYLSIYPFKLFLSGFDDSDFDVFVNIKTEISFF